MAASIAAVSSEAALAELASDGSLMLAARLALAAFFVDVASSFAAGTPSAFLAAASREVCLAVAQVVLPVEFNASMTALSSYSFLTVSSVTVSFASPSTSF